MRAADSGERPHGRTRELVRRATWRGQSVPSTDDHRAMPRRPRRSGRPGSASRSGGSCDRSSGRGNGRRLQGRRPGGRDGRGAQGDAGVRDGVRQSASAVRSRRSGAGGAQHAVRHAAGRGEHGRRPVLPRPGVRRRVERRGQTPRGHAVRRGDGPGLHRRRGPGAGRGPRARPHSPGREAGQPARLTFRGRSIDGQGHGLRPGPVGPADGVARPDEAGMAIGTPCTWPRNSSGPGRSTPGRRLRAQGDLFHFLAGRTPFEADGLADLAGRDARRPAGLESSTRTERADGRVRREMSEQGPGRPAGGRRGVSPGRRALARRRTDQS